VRVKRSSALVILLENDRYVFHDVLGQRTFSANPTALEIVRRLGAWTDLEALAAMLGGYSRASIDRAISQLAELGAIVVEGSDAAAMDDAFDRAWLWGPLAAAYHFGVRDSAFLSAEDSDSLLREQVKFNPSPPLFQTNNDPLNDIPLPVPDAGARANCALFATMAARRTRRLMLDRPVTLDQLADCFLYSMAITAMLEDPEVMDLPLKMTPSGGGRNPYEGYVCARDVTGLAPGTYHFSAYQRTLGVVRAAPPPAFPAMMGGQAWTANAAAVIFLVARFERPMWKYHDPGAYRVTIIEAGHIAQNMMLAATWHGLAANPSGAFTRDLVNDTLRVGGVTQSVIYALVLGVPDAA